MGPSGKTLSKSCGYSNNGTQAHQAQMFSEIPKWAHDPIFSAGQYGMQQGTANMICSNTHEVWLRGSGVELSGVCQTLVRRGVITSPSHPLTIEGVSGV